MSDLAAGLSAGLKGLKKTTITKDHSKPSLSGFVSASDVSSYQISALDYNIERWIDELKDLTFPTAFLALSIDDAKLFIRAYEALYPEKAHKSEDATTAPAAAAATATAADVKTAAPPAASTGSGARVVPADVQKRLDELAVKLQTLIDQIRGPSEFVFVKTSSRSPKDASILSQKLDASFAARLKSRTDKKESISDDNTRIIALLEAATEQLSVRTAKEAIWLLINSERIYQDMEVAIQHPTRFEENIVVRRWVDIDIDLEFRAFVAGGKLTALSQYNHMVYFPRLITHRDALLQTITKFFTDSLQPAIGSRYPKYVVDFAITGPKMDRVLVIEINPFLPTTNDGLFNWSRDAAILEGKAPAPAGAGAAVTGLSPGFEFRLRTKIDFAAKALLIPEWRNLITKSAPATNATAAASK